MYSRHLGSEHEYRSTDLRKRHLQRFRTKVDRFYSGFIFDRHYESEATARYQERFRRYRDSLFTFLDNDGMPWHNNTAERTPRPVAIQGKVSGYMHTSVMPDYLRLLAIRQACRMRGKSLLRFLFSGEDDVDKSR